MATAAERMAQIRAMVERAKAAEARKRAEAEARKKAADRIRAKIAEAKARIASAKAKARAAAAAKARAAAARPGVAPPGAPPAPPPSVPVGITPTELARRREAVAKVEAAVKAAAEAKRKADEARRKAAEEKKRQEALRRAREARERLEKIKEMARQKRERILAKARAPTPVPPKIPAFRLPVPAPIRDLIEEPVPKPAVRVIEEPPIKVPFVAPPVPPKIPAFRLPVPAPIRDLIEEPVPKPAVRVIEEPPIKVPFVAPPAPTIIEPFLVPRKPAPPLTMIEKRLISAGREEAAESLYKKRTGMDLPIEPPKPVVPFLPEKVITPTEPPVIPSVVPTERVPFIPGATPFQLVMQTEKGQEIMTKILEARAKEEYEKVEKYEQMLEKYAESREKLIESKERRLEAMGIPEERRERMMGFIPPEARDIRTHQQLQQLGITTGSIKGGIKSYNEAISNIKKGISEMKAADPSMTYKFEEEEDWISRDAALNRLQTQLTDLQNNKPQMFFEKSSKSVDLTQKGAYGKIIDAYQDEQEAQLRDYYKALPTKSDAYRKVVEAKGIPKDFVGPIQVTEEELGEYLQIDPEISQTIIKHKLIDKYRESMISRQLGKKDTSGFEKAYEDAWATDMRAKGFEVKKVYDKELKKYVYEATLPEDAEWKYAKEVAEDIYRGKKGGFISAWGTGILSYHDPLGLVTAGHAIAGMVGLKPHEEVKKDIIETKSRAVYEILQSQKKGVIGGLEQVIMKSPFVHVGVAVAAPQAIGAGLGKLTAMGGKFAYAATGVKAGMGTVGAFGLARQAGRFKELAEKGEWEQLGGEAAFTGLLMGVGFRGFKKAHWKGYEAGLTKRMAAHIKSPQRADLFARVQKVANWAKGRETGIKKPNLGIDILKNYTKKEGDIIKNWLIKNQGRYSIKIGGSFSQRLRGVKRPQWLVEHDIDITLGGKRILTKIRGFQTQRTKINNITKALSKEPGWTKSKVESQLLSRIKQLRLKPDDKKIIKSLADDLGWTEGKVKKNIVDVFKTNVRVNKVVKSLADELGWTESKVRDKFDIHIDIPTGEPAHEFGYLAMVEKGARVGPYKRVLTTSEQFGRKLNSLINPRHSLRGKDLIDVKNIYKAMMRQAKLDAKRNPRKLAKLTEINKHWNVVQKWMPKIRQTSVKGARPGQGLLKGEFIPRTSHYAKHGGAPIELSHEILPSKYWSEWWARRTPEYKYQPYAMRAELAPEQFILPKKTPWAAEPSAWAEAMARPEMERPLFDFFGRRPTPTAAVPERPGVFWFREPIPAARVTPIPRVPAPPPPGYPIPRVPIPRVPAPPPGYPTPAPPGYPMIPPTAYPIVPPVGYPISLEAAYPRVVKKPVYPTYPKMKYPVFKTFYPRGVGKPGYPSVPPPTGYPMVPPTRYPMIPPTGYPAMPTPYEPVVKPPPITPAYPVPEKRRIPKKVKVYPEVEEEELRKRRIAEREYPVEVGYKERVYDVPDIWGVTRSRARRMSVTAEPQQTTMFRPETTVIATTGRKQTTKPKTKRTRQPRQQTTVYKPMMIKL